MADPFEAELEQLVQRMARDLAREITALILRRLGIRGSVSAPPTHRGRPPSTPHAARGRPGRLRVRADRANGAARTRRVRPTSNERAANLDRVARVVSESQGL